VFRLIPTAVDYDVVVVADVQLLI